MRDSRFRLSPYGRREPSGPSPPRPVFTALHPNFHSHPSPLIFFPSADQPHALPAPQSSRWQRQLQRPLPLHRRQLELGVRQAGRRPAPGRCGLAIGLHPRRPALDVWGIGRWNITPHPALSAALQLPSQNPLHSSVYVMRRRHDLPPSQRQSPLFS